MPFEKELEAAQRIAEQAGRLALENHARGFETETKPDDSPVTSADRANEKLITKLLEEAFPDDGLLGRLAHGEHSHASRDHRRARGCFLCAHRRTSFRAPAALIIFRNAGLGSPCASLPLRKMKKGFPAACVTPTEKFCLTTPMPL